MNNLLLTDSPQKSAPFALELYFLDWAEDQGRQTVLLSDHTVSRRQDLVAIWSTGILGRV